MPDDGLPLYASKPTGQASRQVQVAQRLGQISSALMVLKNVSTAALSQQLPLPLKGDVVVGIDPRLQGYAAIHVVLQEIDALTKKYFPKGQFPFVFGQGLGIVTKGTVQGLIDSGSMQATVILDPKTGKTRHRVTAADAEAFHAKFLTLRTAAAEVGIPKRVIKDLIAANRVVTVSDAHQSFDVIYLRQEIEAVLRARRS